jgi:hypothetical protein
MPSSLKVWLALPFACALLPFIAQVRAGHRAPTNQIPPSPQQAGMSPSAARREWDVHRDWTHFTTRVLGDAVVTESMKALLASGLSPNTLDKYGRTSLHAVALLGQIDLARYLLSKGVDVNARDSDGRTPLMIVASAGGFDLFSGFAPTSPWEFFWTESLCRPESSEVRDRRVKPLRDWYEMVTAQGPMLRLLLDAGADLSARDGAGRDALDHAALGGPTGFARLLAGKAGAGGQQPCDLSAAQSPEVRGLRLGIGLREVAARFRPSGLPEEDSCGRLALRFDWPSDLLGQPASRPQELAGVRRISLGFLSGRLAYLRVTYEREAAPLKPAEFRSTLSTSLRLPGRWRRAGEEAQGDQPYSIACDGFTMVAGHHLGPYVELTDEAALRTLLERDAGERLRRLREEKEEKERRRRVFKP